jgi:putative inorganic carbon (HCO3(-)) transporter
MKAFLIYGLMAVILPLSFFSPFAGLISYFWIAYLRPHQWAWLPDSRISLAVAVATLAGYLIFELPRRLPRLLPNALIVLLWGQFGLATLFAYNYEASQPKWVEFSKTVLIALLVTALADGERRIRLLYLWTVVGIGLLAVRSFIGVVLSGGEYRSYGPGGMFEDNNDYALLLVMLTPMLYYAARGAEQWWLKYGCYALTAMSFTVVFFTRSRGGFLGLCVVALALGLRSKYKVTGLIAAPVAILLVLAIAPGVVTDRLGTIQTAREQDQSAQQRLRVWGYSLQIMRDYPFTGVGARNLLEVYGKYGDPTDARVAHNSFLQLGVDAGPPALFLFLSMIGLSYFRLWRTRGILKQRAPDSPLIGYTHGMQVALLGFMVSGFFVSRYDLELVYEVAALATALGILARSYEREAEAKLAVVGWQLAVDKAQPKVVEPLITSNPQLPTAN